MATLNKVLTSILKSSTYKTFLIAGLFMATESSFGAISKKGWQNTPSPEDWTAFLAKTDTARLKDWSLIKSQGLGFEDLSWEWRLGWVRTCSTASSEECGGIMQLGLFDKALVVRAESATRLGQRFAGTGHPPAIRLLRTAYGIQQNSRSKQPMFVQYRILQALNQIGGEGTAIGKQLSLNSSSTMKYWTRIASK